jgi:hypothetical protein
MSEPSAKGRRLYRSPADSVVQSGMRDDRLGLGPIAGGWPHSSLIMKAVRTSEMSVDYYFTLQYIPEDNPELL